MKPETASHFIRAIQSEFGKSFGAEALERIKVKLLIEPDKAMENAYEHIILNFNPPNMPTAAKLLEIVQKEAFKIKTEAGRLADERQANYRRYDEKHIFNVPQRDQLIKMSTMIIQAMLLDNPDYSEIIANMHKMTALFPGIGMGEMVSTLEQEWRGKGYL